MNSSFSKNLTSSMGISLGGLEVVTDFLFTNPEFYESDLMDVKNNVFGQNVSKQSYEKPVRPKKTKEAIMHKFSILQYTPVIQTDEVLESPTLVGDDTDFDFDFTEEKQVAIETIEDDSEILEANSLMQRLASINSFSESIIDNDDIDIDESEDKNADIDLDIEDDTELYMEDSFDDDFDDSLDLDDDNFELDIEDGIDIGDEDIDTIESVTTKTSIDKLDADTLKVIDNFENNFTTPDIDSIDFDGELGDNIEFEESLDIEDDFDIEEDSELEDSFDIEDIDAIDPDTGIDIRVEEDLDTEDVIDLDESFDIDSDTEIDRSVNKVIKNTPSVDNDSEELRQMQKKFAEMEKQLQELKNAAAKEQASNIKDNVNKVSDTDNIDKLLDSSKSSKTTKGIDKYAQYSLMSIEVLYDEVKTYMIKMGVKTRAIEVRALNERFGELNIRKLIQKSYLIKIGSKGVTVGR